MSARLQSVDWALLGLLSVIWAGSFALIHLAVDTIPPAAMAMGRTGGAALILYVIMRVRGMPLPRIAPQPDPVWLWLIAIGFFGHALPFTLLGQSETVLSSSLAAILNAITPAFVVLLAPFFVPGERLSVPKVVGVVVGFAGVVTLIGWEALESLGGPTMWAQVMVVAVTLSYAINSIIARKLPSLDPITASCGFNLCAALLAAPFALTADWSTPVSATSIGAIAALAILPTAFGSVAYVWLIRRTSTLFVASVNYLIPFWAVVIGTLWMHERIPPQAYLALGLILVGIGLAQTRPKRG